MQHLESKMTSKYPLYYYAFLLLGLSNLLFAQSTVQSIARNGVANLHAEGNTLWVGPKLNFTTNGGQTWKIANVDSLLNGKGRVFSIDVEQDTVWAGLGFADRRRETNTIEDVAMGFAFSVNGGQTWQMRLPPLDRANATTQVYGVSTLPARAVITPVQSPPYDIDYDPYRRTVWTAGFASGIRKSADRGATWQRVVLPPDNLTSINPNTPYSFLVAPYVGPNNGNENHKGFAVLVDERGTIWAGTAGGINFSEDGLSWKRYKRDGTLSGLLGEWVISIEEQPLDGRNPIWLTNWRANSNLEQFALVVTTNGGESFRSTLVGEKLYDLAFKGNIVYAVGDNGLFISNDGGYEWQNVRVFRDANQPDRYINVERSAVSVAVTPEALWVGTSDGLLKSLDFGQTWQLFRTEIGLKVPNPTPQTPTVESYAYPNPFSPASDQVIRLRYEITSNQTVQVRVFDYGMNLVREVASGSRNSGIREEIWDGKDAYGVRIANGVYFYEIRTATEGIFRGKVMILE
jgi:FlgD Ig-like domain